MQGFGQVWILSDPWMGKVLLEPWCIWLVLRQASALGSAAGPQMACSLPDADTGLLSQGPCKSPAKSVGGYLGRQD